MSYTIAIVESPIPADDAEAWNALDALTEAEGPVPQGLRSLHDRLTERYACLSSLSDDEIDDGVWSDGPLWNNFAAQAAVLGVVYSRVEEVLPFIIDTAASLGLAVFDWSTGHIHRPDGIDGLVLTVEDRSPLRRPTLRQILSSCESLTLRGGPGFLVLEGPGEDYTQAAGGDGVFTAEWREYSGSTFRHFVAGIRGRPSRREIVVPTNGFEVTVKENERLNTEHVRSILTAFANREGRPTSFAWRDTTAQFQ